MGRAVVPTVADIGGGLRLVHIHNRGAGAAIFGVDILAGSRNETPDTYGLAHFVEHTIFKGTTKRKAWNIINRMESVGGELNAYTTKEETVVYSVFPSGHTSRAVELISDLICNSTFPNAELDKEREVVMNEINSYLDSPSEAVFDLFESELFRGTPLAHNILGTEETVARLSTDDCRNFIDAYYTAGNMVAFYAGPMGFDSVAIQINRHFSSLKSAKPSNNPDNGISTPSIGRNTTRQSVGSHQAHAVLGITAPPVNSRERYAYSLFANIIGGPGMNSLLNVVLRERRGLVYNVDASAAFYTDTGTLELYFGCDNDSLARCLRLIDNTMKRLADGTELSPAKLDRAKKQYIGQLAIAAENRENRIMSEARTALLLGMPLSYELTRENIREVSMEQLKSVANKFSDSCLYVLGE